MRRLEFALRRIRSAVAVFAALVGSEGSPAFAAEVFYAQEAAVTLPSSNTGWDYIAYDAATGRLFLDRRADGLTVFDVNRQTVVGTVENSRGANGTRVLPEFGRGYVAMTDGTVLVFDPATLKQIDRFKVDDGDLNAGFYDPSTKHLHMVVGMRPQTTTWITLDAATGQVLGRTEFASKKMDDPAVDGHGHIFAPMRDNNVVVYLDSADLKIVDTWKLDNCVQPSAVEYDDATRRVFVGCRGDKPIFMALDAASGKILATLPIGHGIDGIVHDEQRHLIVTANGVDANLSVIRQDGADRYGLVATVGTRPMARVLAMDANTGRLFTVAAGFTQPAPGPDGKPLPTVYHDNSYTVLTYAPSQ
jgi:DNA-binding beta-propeller fold protein YncE